MFHSLSYSVTFPSTGRTLSNKLDFTSGFAAISGPNESGKSMILEMLRFLLFGTQALRGAVDDYKTLKAEGEVTIKSERYRIVRTTKKADIWRGDALIATGVTAVNDKIGRILGFGRAVFDVACSINQGELEQLGSMTSAERKRLVDSVLGIDALDVVSKWGMEEAKLLERDAASLRQRLVCPTAPMEPDGYTPSAEIHPKLELAQTEATELATLTGWLAATRSKPSRPTCSVQLPASALEQFAEKRTVLRHEVEAYRARVSALPEKPTHTAGALALVEQLWVEADAYTAAQKWLFSHPKPRYLAQALVIFRDDWTALAAISHRAGLIDQINALKAKGSKSCPHCGEEILLEADAIDLLQAKHDEIVVPQDGVIPPTPPIAGHLIDAELAYVAAFDDAAYEAALAVPKVSEPTIPRHMISAHRAEIEQANLRIDLAAQLEVKAAELAKMPDYEKMLVERRMFEAAEAAFAQDNLAYEAWQAERVVKDARSRALAGVDARLTELRDAYSVAVHYEADKKTFSAAIAKYASDQEVADELEAKAAEHRKVRDVMNVLRSLIKQHILPSLNKVASHLITGMTGGQRNIVKVDEEFNVLVDNQDINTLSGSGKSVANLALRIALGQVLTNRVMSVLLADEIDASMDDFRAEQTALVLRTLENSISQVLLVSHKSVEADNHVGLGEPSDSIH